MNNFKKSIDGPMGNEFHYLNRLIWFLVFDVLVCEDVEFAGLVGLGLLRRA